MTQAERHRTAGASIAIVFETVRRWFPGDGLDRPTNWEWMIAETIAERPLDRFYLPGTRLVWPHPAWRNRSYLRSQVCRSLIHANIVTPAGLRRIHRRTRQQLRTNTVPGIVSRCSRATATRSPRLPSPQAQ